MAKRELSWAWVWDDFGNWCQERAEALRKKNRCDKCGHIGESDPEWEEQQKAIERIVEKHIRMGKKR